MTLLSVDWQRELPTLEEIDAHIAKLEMELERVRAFREGVRLILSATATAGATEAEEARESGYDNGSAKERLIRVLVEAGKPLKWSELQARVSRGPNPPTPGAITSAYYHNTRSGDRCFVPLPGGYAGLAGRDEGWAGVSDREAIRSEESGKPTLRDLVRTYLASHVEFTLKELQEAIHSERPDALEHTIRGHLSYAKKHGEAESLGRGRWRSLLASEEVTTAPSLGPGLQLECS